MGSAGGSSRRPRVFVVTTITALILLSCAREAPIWCRRFSIRAPYSSEAAALAALWFHKCICCILPARGPKW